MIYLNLLVSDIKASTQYVSHHYCHYMPQHSGFFMIIILILLILILHFLELKSCGDLLMSTSHHLKHVRGRCVLECGNLQICGRCHTA